MGLFKKAVVGLFLAHFATHSGIFETQVTPLYKAAEKGDLTAVRSLLAAGADPRAGFSRFCIVVKTPLDAAQDGNHTAVVDTLMQALNSAGPQ